MPFDFIKNTSTVSQWEFFITKNWKWTENEQIHQIWINIYLIINNYRGKLNNFSSFPYSLSKAAYLSWLGNQSNELKDAKTVSKAEANWFGNKSKVKK